MNPKPKCYIARKEDVTTALIDRAGLQAIAVYPDGNVDHLNNSMMKVEIGPGLMQNVTLDKNQFCLARAASMIRRGAKSNFLPVS